MYDMTLGPPRRDREPSRHPPPPEGTQTAHGYTQSRHNAQGALTAKILRRVTPDHVRRAVRRLLDEEVHNIRKELRTAPGSGRTCMD